MNKVVVMVVILRSSERHWSYAGDIRNREDIENIIAPDHALTCCSARLILISSVNVGVRWK